MCILFLHNTQQTLINFSSTDFFLFLLLSFSLSYSSARVFNELFSPFLLLRLLEICSYMLLVDHTKQHRINHQNQLSPLSASLSICCNSNYFRFDELVCSCKISSFTIKFRFQLFRISAHERLSVKRSRRVPR